jgi:protein tyrosine/serine phosphatase
MNSKFLRYIVFAGFSILLVHSISLFAQDCPKVQAVKNFGCVNSQIYRGEQPTEQGIKELARLSVKTIINLSNSEDWINKESAWASKEGIKMHRIPFPNWFAPDNEKIDRALALLNDSGLYPIFVHCKRGADRTGTLIAAFRINHDGWTADRAKRESKDYHFGWWQIWMRRFIGRYSKEHRKIPERSDN